MKFATVRGLKSRTSEMLRRAAGGERILVTSHGKPVAMIQGMSEDELEDFVLSCHPGIRKSIKDADREYRQKGGIPLAEVRRRLKEKQRKQRGHVHR